MVVLRRETIEKKQLGLSQNFYCPLFCILVQLKFYTNLTQQRLRGNIITYKITYCKPYDPCLPCMHNGLPHFANLIIPSAWIHFKITLVATELQRACSVVVTLSSSQPKRKTH